MKNLYTRLKKYICFDKTFKSKINNDLIQFNCDTQDSPQWKQRAAVAAQLVEKIKNESSRKLNIADIGCGDCKLKDELFKLGLEIDYTGYDLIPQSEEVQKLNIEKDNIQSIYDVVVVLGVIEYLSDIPTVLTKLKNSSSWLVVSLVAKDLTTYSNDDIERLHWKTYITTTEFEDELLKSGFQINNSTITPNGKVKVWLCSSAA